MFSGLWSCVSHWYRQYYNTPNRPRKYMKSSENGLSPMPVMQWFRAPTSFKEVLWLGQSARSWQASLTWMASTWMAIPSSLNLWTSWMPNNNPQNLSPYPSCYAKDYEAQKTNNCSFLYPLHTSFWWPNSNCNSHLPFIYVMLRTIPSPLTIIIGYKTSHQGGFSLSERWKG